VRTSPQVHLSAVLAAVVVACLVARHDWLTGGLVFLTSLGVIEGCIMFLLNWRLRKIRQEEQDFRSSLESTSLDQARLSALAVLPGLKTVARPVSELVPELPATVLEVFARYSRVVFPAGDFLELGSKERGFVHIGRTFDGAALIIREADEALFEWEGPDLPTMGARPDYPSVFHWIVRTAEARISKGQ
jgi:hypothetical protein